MHTYKVDLDYEASIFDPNYQEYSAANQKMIREFEYVFFLVEKEKSYLKNIKGYEKKYLNHLKGLGFEIPEFRPKATDYLNWWGHHHNKEIERHLNSKLTSSQIAHENNWGFNEGAIIENIKELKEHLIHFPHHEKWIIKRPHSFSGIGHYFFNANSFNEAILNKVFLGKVLLEPHYQRVFDIGTTFVINEGEIIKKFMVENTNSSTGGFKGGVGSSSMDKFKKYIWKKYTYSLEELEKNTNDIVKYYLKTGAVSNIQIDSFVYRESNELKLYSLVEVNYRKTMGLVIQSLAEKESDADWVEWRIDNAKKVKEEKLFEDWTQLSPEGNTFRSFFKSFKFNED